MTSRQRSVGGDLSRRRVLVGLFGGVVAIAGCTSPDPADEIDDSNGDNDDQDDDTNDDENDLDDNFLSDHDPFADDDDGDEEGTDEDDN